MSTYSLVDEIKLKAPNWNRDGSRSILSMLNRAQNHLFTKVCDVTTYVDPATGDFPILETTTPTQKYDVPDVSINVDSEVGAQAVRILKVHRLFSEDIHPSDYGFDANLHSPLRGNIASIEGEVTNWNFQCNPALQDRACQVIFPFDPGTYDDRYLMQVTLEPLQLTADSIPLMIPQDDEEILIEGALGWIEYYDYGNSARLDNFKTKLASQFWNKYQKSDSIRKSAGTPRRKF